MNPRVLRRFESGSCALVPNHSSASREKVYCNAQMSSRHARAFCELSADGERWLERAMTQQRLGARVHDASSKWPARSPDIEDT
jgi:predicted ATPase with chaperone activity